VRREVLARRTMSETVVREYPSTAIAVSSARRSRSRKLPLASSARPMSGASYRDALLSISCPFLEDSSDGGQAAHRLARQLCTTSHSRSATNEVNEGARLGSEPMKGGPVTSDVSHQVPGHRELPEGRRERRALRMAGLDANDPQFSAACVDCRSPCSART